MVVAVTDNAEGIYCEGQDRKQNVLIYGTHPLLRSRLNIAPCALFQFCVDRSPKHGQRRTANGQWVQQGDNVFIVGVYTHLFPIARLYAEGFYGWYRIHNSIFKTLQILQVDEDGEPLTDCGHS